jgi:hypothetical protein
MKKITLTVLLAFFAFMVQAQDNSKITPQISVSGQGIVKVTSDQASIQFSVQTKGSNAADIKRQNDVAVDKALAFIKKLKLPKEDVLTKQVSLNPSYDYNQKKQSFVALQTIEIELKDLSKYEELMIGLVNAGVNQIDKVAFKSSKIKELETEARKLAIQDAKKKANDYVSVLAGQKVGKALTITDNSNGYNPQPQVFSSMSMKMEDNSNQETLAVGEMDVQINVSVTFALE